MTGDDRRRLFRATRWLKLGYPACRYLPDLRTRSPGARCTTPFERPDRCCPKCEYRGYMFRARKNVEVPDGKFVETKYRCRSCSHEWWERTPVPPEQKWADAGDAA